MTRPASATQSAASLVVEYRDLAVILVAWPDLPETVRADVQAMAKAPTTSKKRHCESRFI
jgi:hypothetical protein